MMHVEAVIKMLDPAYNLSRITVRRQANRWFKRDTIYRKALDVLRTAEQPLTATDFARKVFEAADINAADTIAAATVAEAVLSSLAKDEGKGVQRVNEGKSAQWKLKESAD